MKNLCFARLLFACCAFSVARGVFGKDPSVPRQDLRHERRTSYGVDVGYGTQMVLSNGDVSGVKLLIVHAQIIERLRDFRKSPVRSFELVNEGVAAASLRPVANSIVGLNELARLDFKERSRRTTFFDIGPGINAFGPRLPELGRKMEFSLQVGIGMKFKRKSGRTAWVIEYRLTHYSDAGTVEPNHGLNMHTVFFGLNILPR